MGTGLKRSQHMMGKAYAKMNDARNFNFCSSALLATNYFFSANSTQIRFARKRERPLRNNNRTFALK